MGGRTGIGAAIGLWVSLAGVAWLVVLPRLRQGSFYEVGDPLIFMGTPILLLGMALGASAGSALDARPDSEVFPRRVTTAALALGAAGVVLYAVLVLWGTGFIGTPQ